MSVTEDGMNGFDNFDQPDNTEHCGKVTYSSGFTLIMREQDALTLYERAILPVRFFGINVFALDSDDNKGLRPGDMIACTSRDDAMKIARYIDDCASRGETNWRGFLKSLGYLHETGEV